MTFNTRIIRIVVGVIVAATMAGALVHGVRISAHWYYLPFILPALVALVGLEFLAAHSAAESWHNRRMTGFVGGMLLYAACGATTWYLNFSTAANRSNDAAGIVRAAYVTQNDTESTEKELSRKLNDVQEKLRLAPAGTAESYRAIQVNTKAHKWWTLTAQCTQTKGPQTREFCDKYASAAANEANATQALTLREEEKSLIAELKTVRANRAAAGPAVTEDTEAHIAGLVKVFHISTAQAKTADSMFLPTVMQIAMLFGAFMMVAQAYRGRTLPTWIDWPKWARRIARMKGEKLPEAKPVDMAAHFLNAIRESGNRALPAV